MGRGAWILVLGAALVPSTPATAETPPARKGLPKSPPRSGEFQKRVDDAVDRGIAWLRKQQKEDGSYFTKWGEGETALALLALRAGGVPGDDPQILRGLDRLRRAYPTKMRFEGGNTTYGVSLTLLALEVHYNSGKPAEAPIPEVDLAWIAALADYLRRSQNAAGGFGYGKDDEDVASRVNILQPGYADNSNSQFAVLGLGAARLLGNDVPADVWRRSLRYWIRLQASHGPSVPWFEASGKDGTLYALGTARARGWAYQNETILAFGSMTAGGVSSVALCREALRADLRADAALDSSSATSLRDGLAWLGRYFTVEGNPTSGEPTPPPFGPPPPPGKRPPKGKPPGPVPEDPPKEVPSSLSPEFQYYYLYGLERAGVLAGTAWVGTRDWYLEGAEYLLKVQRADGSWEQAKSKLGGGPFQGVEEGPQVDTCFALLFLKRATTRLHTPTQARYGTATTSAGADLDPKVGPTLNEAGFADLFKAVFQRFAAGTPERRQVLASDFVRMGTRSIPLLIERLESTDEMARRAALEALHRTTGATREFDPAADAEPRARAVADWRKWWTERGGHLIADGDAGRFREGT